MGTRKSFKCKCPDRYRPNDNKVKVDYAKVIKMTTVCIGVQENNTRTQTEVNRLFDWGPVT